MTKIIVKVGKKSTVRFSHSKVFRAISASDLLVLSSNNPDCNIVIVESIKDNENETVKEFIEQFKKKEDNTVLFYIPDNDDITSGLADELDENIHMSLESVYTAIKDRYGINVSPLLKDKKEFNNSSNKMSDISDIFGKIETDSDFTEDELNENNDTKEEEEYSDNSDNSDIEALVMSSVDTSEKSDNVLDDSIVDEIVKLRIELNDTKHDYSILLETAKASEDRVKDLEKAIESVKQEKEIVQNRFNELLSEEDVIEDPVTIEEYRSLEEEKNNVASEKEQLEESNKQLILDKKALEEENKNLKEDKVSVEESNKQLTSDKERLEKDKEQLTSDKTSLEETNKQLETENTTLKENNKQLETDKEQLTSDKASLEETNKQLTSDKATLEKENERMKLEKDYLDEINKQLESDKAALTYSEKSLKAEKDRLESESSKLNKKITNLEKNNKSLSDSNKQLGEDYKQLEVDYKQLGEEKKTLEVDYENAQNEIKNDKGLIESLNIKIKESSDEFKKELSDKEDELRVQKETFEREKENIQEDMDKKLNDALNIVSEQGQEIIDYRNSLNRKDSLIQQLRSGNEKAQSREELSTNYFEQQIKDLESEKQRLNDKLSDKDTQISTITSQLMQRESEIKRILEDKKSEDKSSTKESEETETLQKMLDSANSEIDKYKSQVTKLEEQIRNTPVSSIGNTIVNNTIESIKYTGRAQILPVFGSGSFGVTTVAMSLAYKLSNTSNVLYIDYDMVAPKADAWFKKMPICKGINGISSQDIRMTGLGILYEKGLATFLTYLQQIVINVDKTKGGKIDYLSGLYHRPDVSSILSTDYSTFFNMLGQQYDYIVIDFGRLGSSEVNDNLIKAITDISMKSTVVTNRDNIEVRNFMIKVSTVGIDLNKIGWLFNLCSDKNISDKLVKLIKPSKYAVLLDNPTITRKRINMTKDRVNKENLDFFINSVLFAK